MVNRIKGAIRGLKAESNKESSQNADQELAAGRYTYGKEYISIKQWDHDTCLKIGSFCSIADNITVFLGGNHRHDWVTTYPFPAFNEEWVSATGIEDHTTTKGDVIIGNDVWIGSGSTILSGVTIGDGAVVAAGSLVTKSVEPYEIVGGNPAKHIKFRFRKKQIESLLKIKWWDWEDEKIAKYTPMLCCDKIDEFIKNAKLISA